MYTGGKNREDWVPSNVQNVKHPLLKPTFSEDPHALVNCATSAIIAHSNFSNNIYTTLTVEDGQPSNKI
jgi:hypothetical protein